MGGRADYEERKEARRLRYEELSKKAEERSAQYMNSNANRILEMTPGQPIIIGHHSEKKARRLHERAWEDIRRSIEEDKKSKYYKDRVESIENSKVIYNDYRPIHCTNLYNQTYKCDYCGYKNVIK